MTPKSLILILIVVYKVSSASSLSKNNSQPSNLTSSRNKPGMGALISILNSKKKINISLLQVSFNCVK